MRKLPAQKYAVAQSEIKAPEDGVIAQRSIAPGALVSPGVPLFGFVGSSSRWVDANFEETQLSKIHIGLPVKVSVNAIPDRTFDAKVSSMGPNTGAVFSLLPANNASGNFTPVIQRVPVHIAFTNLTAADIELLRVGLSANVTGWLP